MQADWLQHRKKSWVKTERKKRSTLQVTQSDRGRNQLWTVRRQGGRGPARSWKEVVYLHSWCQSTKATQTKEVWIIDSTAAWCSHTELMEDEKHEVWRRGSWRSTLSGIMWHRGLIREAKRSHFRRGTDLGKKTTIGEVKPTDWTENTFSTNCQGSLRAKRKLNFQESARVRQAIISQ